MNGKRAKQLRQIATTLAPAMKVEQPGLYRRLKRYWDRHHALPPGVNPALNHLKVRRP